MRFITLIFKNAQTNYPKQVNINADALPMRSMIAARLWQAVRFWDLIDNDFFFHPLTKKRP